MAHEMKMALGAPCVHENQKGCGVSNQITDTFSL